MLCPRCKHPESQVIDTRDSSEAIRRRRECLSCKHRYTTYERSESPVMIVQKKNGIRERYKPDKIRRSMEIACKNRPIDQALIESMVQQVESIIAGSGKDEVSSHDIGEAVRSVLRETDEIAYIRYVSVYEAFSDRNQFMTTINALD
jgi:transcriptional repressor NrdR